MAGLIARIWQNVDGGYEVIVDENPSDGETVRRDVVIARMTGDRYTVTPRKGFVEVFVYTKKGGRIGAACVDVIRERTADGWVTYTPLEG